MTGKSTKQQRTTVEEVKQDLYRDQFHEHSNYSELARSTKVKRDALRGEFEEWGWAIHTVLMENGMITAISSRPIGSPPADLHPPETVPPSPICPAPPAPSAAPPGPADRFLEPEILQQVQLRRARR